MVGWVFAFALSTTAGSFNGANLFVSGYGAGSSKYQPSESESGERYRGEYRDPLHFVWRRSPLIDLLLGWE